MDSKPQSAFPSLCSNGCGFFSTTDKEGLCSVCFKEKLKKEAEESQSPPTTSSSTQTPPTSGTSSDGPSSQSTLSTPPQASSASTSIPDLKETTLSESVPENNSNIKNSEELAAAASSETAENCPSPRKTSHPADEDSDPDPVPAKKPKKNRCASCKKKLGLTGFTCRCGGQFCSLHRYSDKHDCDFDYKAMGEQEISQNNPQILAQKVAKL